MYCSAKGRLKAGGFSGGESLVWLPEKMSTLVYVFKLFDCVILSHAEDKSCNLYVVLIFRIDLPIFCICNTSPSLQCFST